MCRLCSKKVKILMNCCTPEYWRRKEAGRHLECRLIPLDKGENRFRPLVVASKMVKFMEGFIMQKLRIYAKHRLNQRQFGFRPGSNIEDCRYALAKRVEEMKARLGRKEKVRIAFFDFSSAYDNVVRDRLY